MVPFSKSHPLLSVASKNLVTLPSPSSISGWWNFGSLLGLCLSTQLITGLFLAIHYTGNAAGAFESITLISQDASMGWFLRTLHANGASFFFFCLYFHVGRGLYFSSFLLHETWSVGTIILLITMATAFLGYVLPWGQMSFWGTSVITNLLSALPLIGEDIVVWLWGGYAVGGPALVRFYAFHFLTPFIISALVITHLMFLHLPGSSNPLGLSSGMEKSSFHPFFTLKDVIGVIAYAVLLLGLVLYGPWFLGDPENFILANPLVTPVHIQPEWYFLYAYAVLRSIPNKLGGVIALAMAVLIFLVLPLYPLKFSLPSSFNPPGKVYFWALSSMVIILTWIGARPVEHPFVLIGQAFTMMYFLFFFSHPLLLKFWTKSCL